jgi:LmbE family N-acetylglucosaminyl deacetylase/SAM-dependent methyltransferase
VVLVVGSEQKRDFTHVGPGTPATAWRRDSRWDRGDAVSLDGVSRLVVVAAHPDDESLGAGGLISTATRLGVPVRIVCATDGEGSHPDSPTRTPQQLAAQRVEEGVAAAGILGVDAVDRLGLPDGGVAERQDDLTRRLVEVVGDGREAVIVSPWRRDGHPDHEAAGRAAAAAARRTGADLWEYPVWFWHWGLPDEAPWSSLHPFGLDEDAIRSKRAAIQAHRSQVEPLSALMGDETLLPASLLAHFVDGPEHYLRTASVDCADESLDRLHEDEADPWGVESRWFEQRKRDLVLAVLPRPRFTRTLEVGCSTGALAEALAERSERVLAVDSSPAALAAARSRFADDERVTVELLDVPHDWPQDATFDLVVVSEVGYFLSPASLDALVQRIAGSLSADGVVVLCHWRHPVEGWVLDAEDVHRRFEDPTLPPLSASYRDRDVEMRVHTDERGWPDPLL